MVYKLYHLIFRDRPILDMWFICSSGEDDNEGSPSGSVTSWRSQAAGVAHSWLVYGQSPIRNAGLSLALLYMTVLAWGSVAYGFALAQCVSESVLGVLVGASAVVGVLGSLAYPSIRRWLSGAEGAGLVGFATLISTLSLSVVSVWLPGSPFQDYSFGNTTSTTTHQARLYSFYG